MSDQLGLHMSRDQVYSSQHLASLQAPDGTGGVNAGRTCRTNLPVKTYAAPTKEQLSPFQCQQCKKFHTKQIGINFIPVEGGEWRAEVRVLIVIQQTLKACFCVADLQRNLVKYNVVAFILCCRLIHLP